MSDDWVTGLYLSSPRFGRSWGIGRQELTKIDGSEVFGFEMVRVDILHTQFYRDVGTIKFVPISTEEATIVATNFEDGTFGHRWSGTFRIFSRWWFEEGSKFWAAE